VASVSGKPTVPLANLDLSDRIGIILASQIVSSDAYVSSAITSCSSSDALFQPVFVM
jgi:hypothetical protein